MMIFDPKYLITISEASDDLNLYAEQILEKLKGIIQKYANNKGILTLKLGLLTLNLQ